MLRRDNKGPEVKDLQDLLRAAGYNIINDGNFGLSTEAAVIHYQTHADLVVDALAGPKTVSTLRREPPRDIFIDPLKVLINIPYRSQRDNHYKPHSTCNVTSVAMVMDYYLPSSPSEDTLYERLASKDAQAYYKEHHPSLYKAGVAANTVHGMLQYLFWQEDLSDHFTLNYSFDQLEKRLIRRKPVIVSGKFTGSGHIVVFIGLTKTNDYIVHDPYGDWNTEYESTHGEYRIYQRSKLSKIFKPNKIWAHLVD